MSKELEDRIVGLEKALTTLLTHFGLELEIDEHGDMILYQYTND